MQRMINLRVYCFTQTLWFFYHIGLFTIRIPYFPSSYAAVVRFDLLGSFAVTSKVDYRPFSAVMLVVPKDTWWRDDKEPIWHTTTDKFPSNTIYLFFFLQSARAETLSQWTPTVYRTRTWSWSWFPIRTTSRRKQRRSDLPWIPSGTIP